MRRILILFICVVLLVSLWKVYSRHHQRVNQVNEQSLDLEEAPVPVALMTVKPTSAPNEIEIVGTVKALESADLAAKIMSRVSAVLVREGQHVTKGQVLIRLEAQDLLAQVNQSTAGVRSARAGLRQTEIGAKIQITQSSTRVKQAEAALAVTREQLALVREGARRQERTQSDQQVRLAQAAVEAARARLSEVKEGARNQEKSQADQGVTQAESNLRLAKSTYERYKKLYDQDVIAKQQLDEVASRYDVAKSQYEAAKQQASLVHEGSRSQEVLAAQEAVRQAEANLAIAQQRRDLTYEGSRPQEIRTAEAQVRQAEETLRMATAAIDENRLRQAQVNMAVSQVHQVQASLQASRVQLGYSILVAPFSGIVTKRLVDPGAMAAPGVSLLTIENNSRYRLECQLPESLAGSMPMGLAVNMTMDALKTPSLIGPVNEIVPSADPNSRTLVVKINLPKVPGLLSGILGRARLRTGVNQTLALPRSAINERDSLSWVYVVEKGIAHQRLVTTGKEIGGSLEILSGLTDGDQVVIAIPRELKDGSKVSVR